MRAFALAVLLLPAVAAADASAPSEIAPSVRAFLTRLRATAASHDLRRFARMVTSDFTMGERPNRAASLAIIASDPQLLHLLVDALDHGRCRGEPDGVRCARHLDEDAPGTTLFVVARGGRPRLAALWPYPEPRIRPR